MLFQYAQLAPGAIRLVRFHSRSTPTDIHVTLEHQARYKDENVNYTVLSYKPHSSLERKILTLNGRARMIDCSAWNILSAVCGHSSLREARFWIDALSVNQGDEAECRSQLAHQDGIYASADAVLLDPGAVGNDAQKAMTALDHGLDPSSDASSAVTTLVEQVEDCLHGESNRSALQHAKRITIFCGRSICDLEVLRRWLKGLGDAGETKTRMARGSL